MRKDQRLAAGESAWAPYFLCHFTACTFAAAAAGLVNFGPHDLSCPKFVPWCQINAFHPRSNLLLLLLKYEGGEIIETTTITLWFGKKSLQNDHLFMWTFLHFAVCDFLSSFSYYVNCM